MNIVPFFHGNCSLLQPGPAGVRSFCVCGLAV